MRRSPLLQLPLLLCLIVPLLWAPAARADQWTSLAGTSTVTGEMLGMWNGRVLLELEGGRRVAVRMQDLRADSRIQAEKRLAEIQQRLGQQRDEIRSLAEQAAAPAPSDTPELPAAPSYQPPQAGADLRTTMIAARDQLLAGHPRVFYDILPASHQKLVDELVATALAKLNTASFESTRASLRGLAELIVSRQRWLFSHPRLAQLPPAEQDGLVAVAQAIAAVTADDVLNLQTLRSRPLAQSVAALDDAISPHLHRLLAEQSATLAMIDFEVEPGAEGKMLAKVKVPVVGTVSSATYSPLEGRWVPGEDAAAIAKRLQELQKTLASTPDDSVRLPATAEAAFARLDAAVAPLRQAATRQEFHRALDSLMPELVAALNEWSGYQLPNRRGVAGLNSSSGGVASMDSADYNPDGDDPSMDSEDYNPDADYDPDSSGGDSSMGEDYDPFAVE